MTNEPEGTQNTGADSQEYVELHEADDADLDAFLENADKADSNPAQVEGPTQVEPEQQEAEQPVPQDPTAALAAKVEQMQKQLQGQELLIKRRTSQIADLKQKLSPFLKIKKEQLDELYLESPSKAMELQLAKQQAETKFLELNQEEQQLQNTMQAQALLAQHAGPDGFDVETVAGVLLADGLPPAFVQQFVSNPYASALPETLIQLAKRGQAERRASQYETMASQLYYYVQRMMQEANQAPNRVLSNIQNAMKAGPQVTASSGGRGGSHGADVGDLSSLSDAELNQLLGG